MKRRHYRENPLSNTETAVMLVLGAAAVGMLAYAVWPKSKVATKSTSTPTVPSTLPALPTVITVADDGKTFTFARGEAFVIELPQQSGTGYVWSIEVSGDPIIAADQSRSYIEGESDPGALQTVVTLFNVIANTGRAVIKATNQRGATAGRVVSFNINAAAKGLEV